MALPRPTSICPTCGSSDDARRVSTVIDGGTSRSEGSAHTRGGAIRSDGKLTLSRARTSSRSSETSDLAESFSVSGPRDMTYVVGTIAFVQLMIGIYFDSLGYAIGAFFAVIFLGPVVVWLLQRPRQRVAELARDYVRGGYYCFRDDVAYNPIVGDGAPPREYKWHCYWAAEKQLGRR